MGIKILGTGYSLPERVVTNADMEKIVETNDEWIRTRTGVVTRHHSDDDTVTSLGVKAGRQAIDEAGLKPEDIECIIVGTFTGETLVPNAACLIQAELGIEQLTFAFDLNAACTGFIYNLAVVEGLFASGQIKNALVIGAEILTNVTNWQDRTTCVLWGDGCGAAVVQSDDSKQTVFFTAANGDNTGIIESRNFPKQTPLSMEGNPTFRFATKAMGTAIEKVLEKADLTIDEVDYIIPHQANIRIIEYVQKKFKLDPEKTCITIDKYGNTSSSCIPIGLAEMMKKGRLKTGMKVILVGFGGGFTWGAALLEI